MASWRSPRPAEFAPAFRPAQAYARPNQTEARPGGRLERAPNNDRVAGLLAAKFRPRSPVWQKIAKHLRRTLFQLEQVAGEVSLAGFRLP